MSKSTVLTDHDEIRRWAEKRGGRPVRVAETADKDGGGILRFDFGTPDEGLEEIGWDEFFETFEQSRLGLLCGTEGESRFNKFVSRD